MAFRPARETSAQQPTANVNGALATDARGLSFYKTAPDVEVSIREFQQIACDRLRLLHAIDRVAGYDGHLESISQLRPKLSKELHDTRLDIIAPAGGNVEKFKTDKEDFNKRDSTSHFALRLAFCKTREARDWLVKQEQRLFMLRFEQLRPDAQEAFLLSSGVRCKKFKAEEHKDVSLNDLQKTTPLARIWGEAGPPQYDSTFYVMSFTDVHPSFIAARKVVIKRGVAYVPASAMKMILAARFKDYLKVGLDMAFQGLPTALANRQIGSFLHVLQENGMQLLIAKPTSADDKLAGERLTLENFEEFMMRSFPPCMRRLVERQREQKKHLKHAGRLQLRPFLKDCGFTMEDSLRWWKQELMHDKEITETVYDKNYVYDTEHAYGKKGHLQGQNCFGCPKIINFPAEAVGQVHGCPFKQMDMPALKQQLHRWRIPEEHAGEIEKLVTQGKHFQLACMEYFKATHPGSEGDGVGNAPNDFFRESCRWHEKKKEQQTSATGEKA